MRLFAAIRPPVPVLAQLGAATTALRIGAGSPLRWVPTEQQHVTVAFFGEVPGGAASDLEGPLARVVAGFAPLELRLRGAGEFAGRSLWVGVGDGGTGGPGTGDLPRLLALMAAADGLPYAQERDRRRAHLSVARRSRRAADVDLHALARVLSVYSGPAWVAEEVELVASQLGAGPGGGPLHEVIDRFPLRGYGT
ncbi:RNA 2',3'-cyclic phosphodiesterase [Occultella glacieicola]|uniref:RNA 2',3'-cyclic phosphodiesterase n=1 Tax=Occultella glacieicola TaxID=2518684 RepID=A0ABY2E1L4_9MICO|nr:RNA 2',3'-cyclic phosphodiesterase [Occultella glacieicola]TDE90869.1 RNA 2',3'-cyclic phosphodiesterase [Occultella glacieicola]